MKTDLEKQLEQAMERWQLARIEILAFAEQHDLALALITAQRDELASALRAMVQHYGGGPVSTVAEGLAAHRKARGALAKLDGKDA